MTVFAERGIAATSVLDVTKAAGVSNGTFYRYFANKEELEYAIGELVLTGLVAALDEMQRDLSGPERIAIGAFGLMRTTGANQALGSILAEYFEQRNALVRDAAVRLSEHIEEGHDAGEFPVDAPTRDLVGVFIAMFGVGARRVLAGEDPDDVGEFMAAAQLRVLGVAAKRASSVARKVRRQMGAWDPIAAGAASDEVRDSS